MVGGLNVGQWLADRMTDLIKENQRICANVPVAGRLCLDLPLVDISGAVNTISNTISSVVALNELSLEVSVVQC